MADGDSFNDQVIRQFRANGGEVPNFGRSLVLVHHIGARTGTERIAPVLAIADGPDSWLIAASKGGAPDDPAWYRNLLTHPEVTIETPDGDVAVRAEDLEGAERDAAWARFTDSHPGFREYEQRTTRTIPVIRLHRR